MPRLFVGVALDDVARAALAPLVGALRVTCRGARCPDLRDLHVTLRFLGDVDAARVPAVCEALAPLADAQGGVVALRGLGTFPANGRPRVVHAAVDDGATVLATLASRTAEVLAPLGLTRDDLPFVAHVTLARLDPPAHVDLAPLRLDDVAVPVRAVTLFESRSGAAPRYHAVHTFPLVTSTSVRAGPGRQESHDHRPPA